MIAGFSDIRQQSVVGGKQPLSLASRASSPYTGEPLDTRIVI